LGRIGSIKAQSSSGTNNLPMASSMTTTPDSLIDLLPAGNDHF
jgi:hypothetical protein